MDAAGNSQSAGGLFLPEGPGSMDAFAVVLTLMATLESVPGVTVMAAAGTAHAPLSGAPAQVTVTVEAAPVAASWRL